MVTRLLLNAKNGEAKQCFATDKMSFTEIKKLDAQESQWGESITSIVLLH